MSGGEDVLDTGPSAKLVRVVDTSGGDRTDGAGDTSDERELVQRAAREGDADAFAELYRRHLPRIHAFAYRRTGSREIAEDITSATFERALRSLHRFRWQPGGFAPWLFRIAANEIVDHHRRVGRSRSDRARRAAVALAPGPEPAPDELAAGSDRNLLDAMSSLSPRYQRALTLRYLSGLDPTSAAAALGVSKPTMAVVVHRATAALRRSLEQLEADGAT